MLGPELPEILFALLALFVQVGVFACVLVFVVLDWPGLRRHYKVGLALGAACFVLAVPVQIFALVRLARGPALEEMFGRGMQEEMLRFGLLLGAFLMVVIAVAKVGWHALVYNAAASEWSRLEPDALPLLRGRGGIGALALVGCVGVGVAAGVLSAAAFRVLDVGLSAPMQRLRTILRLDGTGDGVGLLALTFAAAIAPAISEELTFRGVLFPLLLRALGRSRAGTMGSAALSALPWAALHVQNTDMPLVKFTQIFVLGLVFAAFARRGHLELAILAHVGLNVAAAGGMLLQL